MNAEQVTIIRPILQELKSLVDNPEDLQTLKLNLLIDVNEIYRDRLNEIFGLSKTEPIDNNVYMKLLNTVNDYIQNIEISEELEDFNTDLKDEILLFYGD